MMMLFLACTPSSTPSSEDPTDDASLSAVAAAERQGVPALGLAVIDGEGNLELGVDGRRRNGSDDLATVDDRWHLGSDTKAMTGVLAGRLVDAGTLTFTTTVAEVFPAADPAWATVTLLDLLQHRGGATGNLPTDHPSVWSGLYMRANDPDPATRTWFVEQITATPPTGPQGDFLYSNAGYMLAGAMLETLDGRSWQALMEAEVFGPLDMTGCGFGPPDAIWGHQDQTAMDPANPQSDNPPALGPAGTVHCDLASWAQFARADLVEQEPFLTAATWAALHTPNGDYAAGWITAETAWSNGPLRAHDGSNTLWYASAWIAPGTDEAYLAITNRGAPNGQEVTFAAIEALANR